jgi:acetyl-CoA carboxylase biotin carboxyl carrier protein
VNRKFRDVEALIRLFEQSGWEEMSVEVDGLSVVLSKDPAAAHRVSSRRDASTSLPLARAHPEPAGVRPLQAQPGHQETMPDGLVAIRAPNLGTFYRAPKPGAAPYVELGQIVEADTEVCLIEVMKLFTPVKAGLSGRIVKICVEDGKMVEYDAPLFFIEPVA